jgi:hypothetical protein
MLTSQIASLDGFLRALWASPSPWVGGILGGIITGGIFGWVAYLRNIRPTLIFFRCQEGERRIWQLKNVGQGVAAYVRIRDYASDKKSIVRKVRTYPIGPNDPARELVWVTAGGKLEALYTDAYGRRSYRTICDENENEFSWSYRSLGRRPTIAELRDYQPEIDVLREYERNNKTP